MSEEFEVGVFRPILLLWTVNGRYVFTSWSNLLAFTRLKHSGYTHEQTIHAEITRQLMRVRINNLLVRNAVQIQGLFLTKTVKADASFLWPKAWCVVYGVMWVFTGLRGQLLCLCVATLQIMTEPLAGFSIREYKVLLLLWVYTSKSRPFTVSDDITLLSVENCKWLHQF